MASTGSYVLLYHESQVAALCGVHCLNTLLQGPYFSEIDLAQIAAELDALERSVMAEGGMTGEDYLTFMAMESGNVANDGMFSIQVLGKALQNWGVSYASLDSPDMQAAAQHPDQEQAFICNLREHWFTVRNIADEWWDFNSLLPAPRLLSHFYLSAYLSTLKQQGYSIFVIRGDLPVQHSGADMHDAPGRWFTPEEAKQRSADSEEAKQGAYLKAALERLLPEPGTDAFGNAVEPQPVRLLLRPRGQRFASATAPDSMGAWQRGPPASSQQQDDFEDFGDHSSNNNDEDDDLARAIAASLADSGTPKLPVIGLQTPDKAMLGCDNSAPC